MVDKVINVAKCFVTNFVSAVLGTINGLVNSLLGFFIDTLTGFIDGAFGIVDKGLSLASGAFNIILDVISFLSCNDDKECEAYNIDQWNILTGGNQDTYSITDLIQGVTDVTNQVSNVTYDFSNLASGVGDIVKTFGDTLQQQLNGVFDISTCNIGPILCGPPSISLFGGTGGFAG